MKTPATLLRLVRRNETIVPAAPVVDMLPPLEPWMAVSEWLEGVSNAHLAVLLTEHQLLFTAVGTFASDLISEVIDRLEGRPARLGARTREERP
jgi:hypothetical protein